MKTQSVFQAETQANSFSIELPPCSLRAPADSPLSRLSEDPSEEAAAASEAALSNSASAFHSLSACSSAFRVVFWHSEMQLRLSVILLQG